MSSNVISLTDQPETWTDSSGKYPDVITSFGTASVCHDPTTRTLTFTWDDQTTDREWDAACRFIRSLGRVKLGEPRVVADGDEEYITVDAGY